MDQNFKIRIAEQLREEVGSSPDHIFLLLQARRLPQSHMHRKSPWRSKGSDAKGCSTHMPFWQNPSWLRDAAHTWEYPKIWTLNQANQHDWPKETQKSCHMKVLQTAMRVQLSNSLSEPTYVSIQTYCTLFLLINTLLSPLLSIMFPHYFMLI